MIIAGWSAYPRQLDFAAFREIADEVGAKLMVDMAHFAGLVAAGVHPNPVPHADVVTTTIHKTLGGPRGGMILCREELAKKINRAVFPGQQGGPLMHVIAAKAVAFKIARSRGVPRPPAADDRQRAGARRGPDRERGRGAHRRHRRAPGARRPRPDRARRQEAEDRLDEVGITVNRNAIPFDPRPPMDPSGLRIGTPGADHPRAGRGRHARDRRADRWRALGVASTSERDELSGRSGALMERYPLYPQLAAAPA